MWSFSAKMRKKLGRKMRLNTHDVANVLKHGKRVRWLPGLDSDQVISLKPPAKPCIEARAVVRIPERLHSDLAARNRVEFSIKPTGARFATAVPKRLLKKAVERNLVKRWMRESLRQHTARTKPVDVLLTLTAKLNLKTTSERMRVKQQINSLLATVDDLSTKRKLPTRN